MFKFSQPRNCDEVLNSQRTRSYQIYVRIIHENGRITKTKRSVKIYVAVG